MVRGWQHRIRIRHLIEKGISDQTPNLIAVQKSMNSIADVLEKDPWFKEFSWLLNFRRIEENEVVSGLEFANILMEKLYDYCDRRRIWIELLPYRDEENPESLKTALNGPQTI